MDLTAILGFAAAVLGTFTAVLAMRNEALKSKLSKIVEEVSRLKEFAANVYSIELISTDVFVLGPRSHGKTSIVTALTEQWQSVNGMSPTPIDFKHFTWKSIKYTEDPFTDENLGVGRTLRKYAFLNIFDYAGEDQAIAVALSAIQNSEKYILVFVMSCEDDIKHKSSTYFNLAMLKSMRSALKDANSDPRAVLILFSKHDVSPFSDHLDLESIPNRLIELNRSSIDNIEIIFGNTEKFIVSAETGLGLSGAFRYLLSHVVDKFGHPKE